MEKIAGFCDVGASEGRLHAGLAGLAQPISPAQMRERATGREGIIYIYIYIYIYI